MEKRVTPPRITNVDIVTKLSSLPKSSPSERTHKKNFHEIKEKYLSFTEIYADAIVYDIGVGIVVRLG